MISCDSLPDIHWFYYCYIVIHRRGDTIPHLLLFYRISWVYRRVSPLLWRITSSCFSAWRRVEIKGDSIVSGDWWCENVKMWNCEIVVFPSKNENVKMWKCEIVKSWCFRQNRNREKWKGEKVKRWNRGVFVKRRKKMKKAKSTLEGGEQWSCARYFLIQPHNRRSDIQITCSRGKIQKRG